MTRAFGERPAVYRLMYLGRSSRRIERELGARLTRLAREGFEVHVLAADDGGFGALSERGVRCKPLPIGRKANLAGLIGAFFIVQAYFLEKRPVLVHTFDDVLPWLGALAARRAQTEAIFVTVERHAFDDEPLWPGVPGLVERFLEAAEGPLRGGMTAAYRRLAEWTDKYCVTNERDFQALQDGQLVPDRKLEMIIGGAGVDLGEFDVEDDDFPSVEQAREELEVPGRWRHVLGHIGHLDGADGVDELVEAIEALGRSHPSCGWLIGLEPGASSGGVRRLERLEGRGLVRLFERVEQPAHFYRALDLFAHPGRHPRQASRLMEAAAGAVGAVAFETPAAASIIEQGQTGALVPPADVGAFVEALRSLVDDPNRVKNYGQRARSRAVRTFNREHVEGQILRLYDSLLELRLEGTDDR
ncbi:MAG: glycosyltransferase [Persicimonas sp.]